MYIYMCVLDVYIYNYIYIILYIYKLSTKQTVLEVCWVSQRSFFLCLGFDLSGVFDPGDQLVAAMSLEPQCPEDKRGIIG
jgi:hypothetical protein